ncbi:hypothetical protein Mycsm_00801 [Mycobacterium sp. JS623]|nr:hypothetical protein Mycsm_00801 [Mycobacterium sp. JS623]
MLAPHKNDAVGRRMFWAGFLIGSVSAFFIAFPPDWKSGTLLSLLVAVLMLMTAYFTSPYLKFGGKVIAFSTADAGTGAQDAAFTSARKLWWLMVPAMALCAFNIGQYVIHKENPRLAAVMAVAVVAVAIVFGYGDGRARYSIARRQLPQFVVVSFVTLGLFTVLYFGGYALGKQRSRPHRQSMDDRA